MNRIRWCTPVDSSVRRHLHHQQELLEHRDEITRATTTKKSRKEFRPIGAFGIVAAICAPSDSKNTSNRGILGVNGKLPWDSLPSDRKIFERLTRDRILIVGRRTLLDEREGNLDHVHHAKHCIIVSKSMSNLKEDPRIVCNKLLEKDSGFLKLARSLDEALDLARDLETGLGSKKNMDSEYRHSCKETSSMNNGNSENGNSNNEMKPIPSLLSSSGNIQCWVAGGERLYEEALQHQSASEVHLSVVDVEIDLTSRAVNHVAMFPAKNRWDQNYELINKTPFPLESKAKANQDQKLEPSFVYHIYKRIV
jgi:dihydrofolate reductase